MRYLWVWLFLFSPLYAASHHPQDFLKELKNDQESGKKIFDHFCASCHAQKPLIEVGAPKINHRSEWVFRLKKGKEAILESAKLGLRMMPPRGGCFECSDEQLLKAIEYMLPAPKKD